MATPERGWPRTGNTEEWSMASQPNDESASKAGSVNNTTTSAARAADILLHFTNGPLGVSRVARELNLSKAVVHRVLTTFVDRGLLVITTPDREYALGPAAAALGASALRSSPLREIARPLLTDLQQQTGETATVTAMAGRGRIYLDQVESRNEIKMTVELGRRFPLHTGSSGRAILAFQTPALNEAVLAEPLDKLTPATITDPDALRASLQEIREKGWCVSSGERQEGASSIAAPVFDLDGLAVGALSVCGPIHRMTNEVLLGYVPIVTAAADQVSRTLGWRGGLPTDDRTDDA